MGKEYQNQKEYSNKSKPVKNKQKKQKNKIITKQEEILDKKQKKNNKQSIKQQQKIQQSKKIVNNIPQQQNAFRILEHYNPDTKEVKGLDQSQNSNKNVIYTVQFSHCYAVFNDGDFLSLGSFSTLEKAYQAMYDHICHFTKIIVEKSDRVFENSEENRQAYIEQPRKTIRTGSLCTWEIFYSEVDYLWQIFENQLDQTKKVEDTMPQI